MITDNEEAKEEIIIGNGITTSDLIIKSEFQPHSMWLIRQSAVAVISASKLHKTEQAWKDWRKQKQPIDDWFSYHGTGKKGGRWLLQRRHMVHPIAENPTAMRIWSDMDAAPDGGIRRIL